jgi:dTDP-4-dehydrorhamnose reductase
MVADNLIVPTYVDDIALALGHLIERYTPEVFHAVGPEAMSAYDLGLRIAKHYGYDMGLISKTTYKAYSSGKAVRPQYANIVTTKDLKVKMRRLEEGLKLM